MVQVLGDLLPFRILSWRASCLADVVMRAHEDHVVGMIEEAPDCLDLRLGCDLGGAKGIEADDDHGINICNQGFIDLNFDAIVADPFDLNNRVAC